VIISDEDIDFPKVEHPDILIVLSQEAYLGYVDDLKENAILIVDPDLVPNQKKNVEAKIYEVPATRIAEELGKKIVANVVMIGAFAAITDLFDLEQLKESIRHNVPKAFVELNLAAFEKGYAQGKSLLKS
jgi:2-oxoglutarate ferredoxin oxidoreductase subunit gamma